MSSEQADEAPVTEVVLDVEGTRWSFDAGFLRSGWTCIWGQGCLGIEDEADTERQLGCCSVGAELIDDDEARLIGALGSTLDPALFEQAPLAAEIGVLNETGRHTWVVADRCIFHNSVDFEGGVVLKGGTHFDILDILGNGNTGFDMDDINGFEEII